MDQFRFMRLRDDFSADVVPVPLELRPSIPQAGVSARERHLGHSERVEQRLIELAAAEGEAMVLPDLVPNTHLAIVLGEYGRDLGERVYWPLHLDIFRAYYVNGYDLGDREVLLKVARAHGLDEDEVIAAWGDDTYEDRLHEFHHMVLHLGIDTTPAALICNELLIGSRPYGVLRDAVQRCLVRPDTLDAESEPEGP
ncbi:MAG: DsbA family oxidoreductase [Coriobacteriia bacterium]